MNRTPKAFTLIELIVVVGIIGLMASVVISALTVSRLKARDAAIRQGSVELRTLMNRELSDNGSYANLKSGGAWKASNGTCTVGTLGNVLKGSYAADAKKVCDEIIRQSSPYCGSNCVFFFSANPNTAAGESTNTVFSIMTYLPGESSLQGAAMYLCMGSSGRMSIHNSGSDPTFSSPGCSNNP